MCFDGNDTRGSAGGVREVSDRLRYDAVRKRRIELGVGLLYKGGTVP